MRSPKIKDPKIKLSKANTCLEFNEKDMRFDADRECDHLVEIPDWKRDRIRELNLLYCQISPKVVTSLLDELKHVNRMKLADCTCHENPDEDVPEFERKLEVLEVYLDLNEDADCDFFDCHQLLLHRYIRLPTEHLQVSRNELAGPRLNYYRGGRYLDQFDLDAEYVTYMVKYVRRFRDVIKFISFDTGRPRIWNKFSNDNGLDQIDVDFIWDIDEEEQKEDTDESYNSSCDSD